MVVIVPHKDIELKLINAQKQIIKSFLEFDKEQLLYCAMPLWIRTTFDSVEQAKKEITKVTVFKPEYDDFGCLFCPVKIECTDGKVLESKLDFIRGLKCHYERHVAIQTTEETFPLPVKIFRLGECTSPKPGVYELASTVWKKTSS